MIAKHSNPADRQGFIGGTDIHHVLSLEPYGCARQLWYEKTGAPEDRPFRMTGPIVMGKLMEDGVAEMVKERTGWKIRRRAASANGHELQRVDREIVGHPSGPGVLEIKTVGDRVYWQWKMDGVPIHYQLQVQWYLHVLGWKWACLAVLNRDTGQLNLIEMNANVDLQKEVAHRADQFMTHHIERRIAPPWLEERDDRCESCRWQPTCQMDEWASVHDNGLIQISGLAPLMAEYSRAKDIERQAQDVQETLRRGDPESDDAARRSGIEALLGDNEQAMASTSERVVFKVQEQLRVNVDLLKLKYPDVYTDVLRRSVSRPLRVLKIKGATK